LLAFPQNRFGDKRELLVVFLCIVGLAGSLAPLVSETVYQHLFTKIIRKSESKAIGAIESATNDIRHKSQGAVAWEKAKKALPVREGDSIYTGANSTSEIKMEKGGNLSVSENSLVTFVKKNRINIPNLALGNFQVAVQGKMQVSIGGKITEIAGEGSVVEIKVSKNQQAQIRLVQGTASVESSGRKSKLKLNETLKLSRQTAAKSAASEVASNVTREEAPPIPILIEPSPLPEQINHYWTFEDFFDKDKTEGKIQRRLEAKSFVNLSIPIEWPATPVPTRVQGQLSNTTGFENVPEIFLAMEEESQKSFSKAFIGDNYVRLSIDGQNWSSPKRIQVVPTHSDLRAPQLKFPSEAFHILDSSTQVRGQIQSDPSAKSFVIEISSAPDFSPQKTHVKLLSRPDFEFRFSRESTVYFRAQSIHADSRLSEVSMVTRIQIDRPPIPVPPILISQRASANAYDEFNIEWHAAPTLSQFVIEVLDSKDRIVLTQTTTKNSFQSTLKKEGSYNFKVKTIDRFGRASAWTAGKLKVLPSAYEVQKRKHASEQAAVKEAATIPNLAPKSLLESLTIWSVEGIGFTSYSQEQVLSKNQNPVGLGIAIRRISWKEVTGFEFSVKAATTTNQTKSSLAAFQLEAHYHRRWTSGFNPFSRINDSVWSWQAGGEYYRSQRSGSFSPGYNLLKMGLNLDFPFLTSFNTGGKFGYGLGLEQSMKFEIEGYLQYRLRQDLGFGVGYRVHLFQAGSEQSSPQGLPFREGYGEGYSVLKWLY